MTIRAAAPGDAAAICAIWNPIIRDTFVTFTTEEKTESGIAAEISARRGAFIVAEHGGEVIGFAAFAPFRSGPGYVHTAEHTIHLAPRLRGRRIGRALMARLEAEARARGVRVLIAGVSGANPGGIAFHAALGFAEVGRLPGVGFKFGRWLDLVLMQKMLAGPSDAPDKTDSGR